MWCDSFISSEAFDLIRQSHTHTYMHTQVVICCIVAVSQIYSQPLCVYTSHQVAVMGTQRMT